MTSIGYTLSSEEHPPRRLVEQARRAEDAGFDFVSLSDHFHPWVSAQGHSPFAWSVLGAVAAATGSVQVAVGVTCPLVRIHPAVIAQAAATMAELSGGRFVLGLGTGEALNEHVLGHRWPPAPVRLDMLDEAVGLIRELWTGEKVDHRGDFYTVENARLFDPPTEAPPVVISGFGDGAARLAARIGDGFWGHAGTLETYRAAGGTGPSFAQLHLCWAEDEQAARKTVHHVWPNAAIPGQLAQDLPTWTHFEQAAELVDEQAAVADVPCGPDPEPVIEAVRTLVGAGFDHVYLHQIGEDQEGFFEFWHDSLAPALGDLRTV